MSNNPPTGVIQGCILAKTAVPIPEKAISLAPDSKVLAMPEVWS
jgi:hypothetical protein